MTNFAKHIVQEVPVNFLLGNLDASVDNFYDCGCEDADCWECTTLPDFQSQLLHCLSEKLDECSDSFIGSMVNSGQRDPICIRVEYNGTWTLGNGHHRLAVAVEYSLPSILVVFSEDYDYMMEELTDPENSHGEECHGCGCYTCHCDERWCDECMEWECMLHLQCGECGCAYPVGSKPCCCEQCGNEPADCICEEVCDLCTKVGARCKCMPNI